MLKCYITLPYWYRVLDDKYHPYCWSTRLWPWPIRETKMHQVISLSDDLLSQKFRSMSGTKSSAPHKRRAASSSLPAITVKGYQQLKLQSGLPQRRTSVPISQYKFWVCVIFCYSLHHKNLVPIQFNSILFMFHNIHNRQGNKSNKILHFTLCSH
jgi:hypothetical protein